MREKLVHANSVLPPNQHFIRITVPNGVSYEVFQTAQHPGWDSKNETICKALGETWYREQRSALLFVPSIPARIEGNILINPLHPHSAGIAHDLPEPSGGTRGFTVDSTGYESALMLAVAMREIVSARACATRGAGSSRSKPGLPRLLATSSEKNVSPAPQERFRF